MSATERVTNLCTSTGHCDRADQLVSDARPLDAWNSACLPSLFLGSSTIGIRPNCPKNIGNDTDSGMAPAFVPGSEATPGGKDVVVAGQKNANLYAFSAQTGTTLWGRAVAPGGLEGGLSWGVAVDNGAVY
jgi:hypothetical protein